MKKTPWFDGRVKPVRRGVYESEVDGGFRHWNGRYWGFMSNTPEKAEYLGHLESQFQHCAWRGIEEKA